jgi:hypothetical protein
MMQLESTLKAEQLTRTRETMIGNMSEQNRKSLESIREIIEVEEAKTLTLDETLSRVLRHYRRFVPFQMYESMNSTRCEVS